MGSGLETSVSGLRGGSSPETNQNVKPMRATRDRGCRKCVPLKVDRKLYRATLLVRLAISSDAVNFSCFSVCNRLSLPMPRLNTLRGFTRSGLWSSFSWPACGRVISFDVTVPLHEVMGLL